MNSQKDTPFKPVYILDGFRGNLGQNYPSSTVLTINSVLNGFPLCYSEAAHPEGQLPGERETQARADHHPDRQVPGGTHAERQMGEGWQGRT